MLYCRPLSMAAFVAFAHFPALSGMRFTYEWEEAFDLLAGNDTEGTSTFGRCRKGWAETTEASIVRAMFTAKEIPTGGWPRSSKVKIQEGGATGERTGCGSDLSNPWMLSRLSLAALPQGYGLQGSALPSDSGRHSSTGRESRPLRSDPSLTAAMLAFFCSSLCSGASTMCALHVCSVAPNTHTFLPSTQGKPLSSQPC